MNFLQLLSNISDKDNSLCYLVKKEEFKAIMKKSIILTFMLFLCKFVVAQEAHSPQFKCSLDDDLQETKYLLIGNKFPQNPSLDFSNEVIFVKAQEYATASYPEEMKFFITKKMGNNFQTDVNIIDNEKGLTQTSMIFENNILTFIIQHPLSTCEFEHECVEEKIYNCDAQIFVDLEDTE